MEKPSQIFYSCVLHTSGEHAGHLVIRQRSMHEGNPGYWWVDPFNPMCFGSPLRREELGTTVQEAEDIGRRRMQAKIEEHRKAILEMKQALLRQVMLLVGD